MPGTVGETIDLTSFSNFMKVRGLFDKHIEQYKTKKFLLENYEQKAGEVRLGGRTMEIPLKIRGSASFGAALEHEGWAEPDMPAAAIGQVRIATLTSSILISLQAALTSRDKRASWVSAQMEAMTDTMEMFGMNHSRVLHGDGTGAIAKVKAITVGPPIVIELEPDQGTSASFTFGTKYMIRGLWLSASSTKTGTASLRTARLRVVAVDDVLNKITCTGSLGDLANADFLFIGTPERTSKGRMPIGLFGSVNDGSILQNYLGVDRGVAGNEWWEATERTGVGAADLEDELQLLMDTISRKAGGQADTLLFSLGVWRRFAKDLRGDRQFITAAETGKYKGGTKLLMYTGEEYDAAIVRDRDIPSGTITALDWSTHKMGTLLETQWLQAFDEKSIFRNVPGTFDYCAVVVHMGQPFCVAPIKNGTMRGINEVN